MLCDKLINLSHSFETKWVEEIFVAANVQELSLCFAGIEFVFHCVDSFEFFSANCLEFCEQAGVDDCRTTTVGIGGHHYEHCAINICFRTFVAPNYRRYNDRCESIMILLKYVLGQCTKVRSTAK